MTNMLNISIRTMPIAARNTFRIRIRKLKVNSWIISLPGII